MRSKNAAIKYAKQYAKGWTVVYPKYSADYTNFVSQCLKAGGIPTVGSRNQKGIYSSTTVRRDLSYSNSRKG